MLDECPLDILGQNERLTTAQGQEDLGLSGGTGPKQVRSPRQQTDSTSLTGIHLRLSVESRVTSERNYNQQTTAIATDGADYKTHNGGKNVNSRCSSELALHRLKSDDRQSEMERISANRLPRTQRHDYLLITVPEFRRSVLNFYRADFQNSTAKRKMNPSSSPHQRSLC